MSALNTIAHTKAVPPETDILAAMPESWVPFAELMRVHKPVGIMNIYFPYLFGLLFAGCVSSPVMDRRSLLLRSTSLFGVAFILRSAGCTWNDIIDRDIDRLVERTRLRPMARERTRLRPMARGAISLQAAYAFTVVQTGIWLALLSCMLTDRWLLFAAPLLFLVWLYPFAKRFTDYVQMLLGITLGWGVLVGAKVGDLDMLDTVMDERGAGLAGLYSVYLVWTVIHDTIYAHQDVRDDAKAGIRSMAVRWLNATKALLWGLAVVQLLLLWSIGTCMGAGAWYFWFAVCGNLTLLSTMILELDLSNPQDCFWWFQTGSLVIGTSIAAGLLGEYTLK